MIVPWTVLDGALVVHAFRFGKEDFNSPLIRRWFTVALPCMIGFAGLLLYSFVHEFHDAIGWYVAFGQNLMMSILFVAMLLRRHDLRGQSQAIAPLLPLWRL
jgi:hypothetical protein